MRRTVIAAALLALLAVARRARRGRLVARRAGAGEGRRPDGPHGHRQRPDEDASPWPSCKALPAYEGYFGFMNSAGTIYAASAGQGRQAHRPARRSRRDDALSSPCDVSVVLDDYGMTYTYDQVVNGAETVFDKTTREPREARRGPVSLVVIYEVERRRRCRRDGGPAAPRRRASRADVNQVADGHLMVKWVEHASPCAALCRRGRSDVRAEAQERHAPDVHVRPDDG